MQTLTDGVEARRVEDRGTNVGGMQTEEKLCSLASEHIRMQSELVILGEREVWSIIEATFVGKGGGGEGWGEERGGEGGEGGDFRVDGLEEG